MNTQNENQKKEKPASRLYLVEKGTWKNGQEVITVYYKNDQGKPIAVGHVYVFYDKQGMTFRSQDSKGNELFPSSHNRFDLKKQFLDNEQDLIQKIEKKPEQEKNPVQQNLQPQNQPQQVQQPTNNPEQPKVVKTRTTRREKELNNVHQEKDNNEQNQTLTH